MGGAILGSAVSGGDIWSDAILTGNTLVRTVSTGIRQGLLSLQMRRKRFLALLANIVAVNEVTEWLGGRPGPRRRQWTRRVPKRLNLFYHPGMTVGA